MQGAELGAVAAPSQDESRAEGSEITITSGHRFARLRPAVVGPLRRNGLPAAIGTATAAAYGYASWLSYVHLQSGLDLAIFREAVARYSSGSMPWSMVKGRGGFNLLGDHFSPIIAVLAPVYHFAPDPRTLLLAQAILIGIAAFVVSATALQHLGKAWCGLIGIAFSYSWGVQGLALFEFHEVAFALPVLALACKWWMERRSRRVFAALLVLFLVKEDAGVVIVGFALAAAARRAWKWSLALAFIGIGGTAVVVRLIIPHFSFYGTWTYGGALQVGSGSLLGGVLERLTQSLLGGGFQVLAMVLACTALLACGSPLMLVALPMLASRLLSDQPSYWGVNFHYNGTLMVIAFMAVIDTLVKWSPCWSWWVKRLSFCALAAASIALFSLSPLPRRVDQWSRPCPACDDVRETLSSLGVVDPRASAAATPPMLPYMPDTMAVHELKPTLMDSSGRQLWPQFVVLDCVPDQARPADWQRSFVARNEGVYFPFITLPSPTPGCAIYILRARVLTGAR